VILSVLGMVAAWLLKVESCFPIVLDPTHFHSNRPRAMSRSDNTSAGSLDASNTSLLQQSNGDGILNHQYGKGSIGPRAVTSTSVATVVPSPQTRDIELNGTKNGPKAVRGPGSDVKSMTIGDSTTKVITGAKASTNPTSYSRLPV
jgi:hypothetical protein